MADELQAETPTLDTSTPLQGGVQDNVMQAGVQSTMLQGSVDQNFSPDPTGPTENCPLTPMGPQPDDSTPTPPAPKPPPLKFNLSVSETGPAPKTPPPPAPSPEPIVLRAMVPKMDTSVPAPPPPPVNLRAVIDQVNPTNSVINCGYIIDAVIDRLRNRNPNAIAQGTGHDGTWGEIAARHNIVFTWRQGFPAVFNAVRNGGEGTTAIIGIVYSNGTSHVIVITNRNGVPTILEGQDWGAGNPRELITDVARAEQRYNNDGGSNVGYGILP